MSDVLDRKKSAKNGTIQFLGYNFKEQSRLEFNNALITEIAFPAFDANSKGPAHFTLTLQPEATRISTASNGNSVSGFSSNTHGRKLATDFRLKITGLETACGGANKIDSIIVKQPTTKNEQAGLTSEVLIIPNIAFTVAESKAKDFYDWFDDFVLKGKNAPEDERTGTFEFLSSNMKTVLFTLTFVNVGIFRIQKQQNVDGAGVIARVGVEIYCEKMTFTSADESVGSIVTSSASKRPPIVSSTNSVNVQLAETLLGIMSGRIREEDALRTTLRIVGLPQTTNSNEAAESELIARRLLTTVHPAVSGPSVSKRRDDGTSIGERWAADKATLEELEQIVTLDSVEWTAVRLEGAHSLIAQLLTSP